MSDSLAWFLSPPQYARSSFGKLYEDRLYEGISKQLKYITDELQGGRSFFFGHHADGDGLCSQAILNRLAASCTGREIAPKKEYYPIIYEDSDTTIGLINHAEPEILVFSDYYPHPQEFKKMHCLNKARRVIIFDKHPGREDISEVSSIAPGTEFVYINPHNHMIPAFAKNPEEFGFKHGTPVGYFLGEVATKEWRDCVFLQSYSLRSYGFVKEADNFEGLKHRARNDFGGYTEGEETYGERLWASYMKGANLNDAVLLMASHRISHCPLIVDALSRAESYEDEALKEIFGFVNNHKLKSKSSQHCGEAASLGGSFTAKYGLGRLSLFPLKAGMFEQTKAFSGILHRKAQEAGNDTTMIILPIKKRFKVSVRTEAEISLTELFRKAFDGLPEWTERNYGAHEKAGGFTCRRNDFPDVMAAVINEYFRETGQNQEARRDWFLELYSTPNQNNTSLFDFT